MAMIPSWPTGVRNEMPHFVTLRVMTAARNALVGAALIVLAAVSLLAITSCAKSAPSVDAFQLLKAAADKQTVVRTYTYAISSGQNATNRRRPGRVHLNRNRSRGRRPRRPSQNSDHAGLRRTPATSGSSIVGRRVPYRSGRKAIGRVSHYAKQTYYSPIRRDSVCNTFQDPVITSVIDAKKITAWGESGFPARFLWCSRDRRWRR